MLVERTDKTLFCAQDNHDGCVAICTSIQVRGVVRRVFVNQQQRVADRRSDYPRARPNTLQTAARFTRACCSDATHCTDHGFEPVHAVHARLDFAEFVTHVEAASGAGAAPTCTARSRTAVTSWASAGASSEPVATSAAGAAGPPCASRCAARRMRTVAMQLVGSMSNTPSARAASSA